MCGAVKGLGRIDTPPNAALSTERSAEARKRRAEEIRTAIRSGPRGRGQRARMREERGSEEILSVASVALALGP